jgi:multidrug efflux pump subunit AcrA (membrane-fusion protein)
VTAVSLQTGRPIAEATTVLELSGRPVITLRLPFPLYRTINPYDAGSDVTAVQAALAAAGLYEGEPTGIHDAASQAAVRSLYDRAGASAPSTGAEIADRVDAAERAIDGIDAQLDAGATVPQGTIDGALRERTAARRAVGIPVLQAEIAAPPAGAVSKVEVEVGTTIGAGEAIATTIGDAVSVTCTMPTAAIAGLPDRPSATLSVGDEDPVRGVLGKFSSDENGSTARFTPDSAVPARHSGSEGTLTIVVSSTKRAVLTVPATAMREGTAGPEVRVLRAATARRVPVTTGLIANGWVEIRSKGLDTSDRVVLAEPEGP